MKQSFKELAAQYREELFGSVLPFWMEKSPDTECGGYFTCLDRYGNSAPLMAHSSHSGFFSTLL